ncbi:Glycosyltransferase, catalytic subunit of cellulose synthase and poly-beta-1,6-N-acetylglucosamine synthase [Sinosporangium album]|uniref:Glycosyltransferase, catalytic subunit of cellulose synthase and poly-beta-1,6-N-acetylglucosamine synthase n=1 Tax=Sinosporangium album TaxID=504805 RepID=A0A1G8H2H5_9ACTN|nr:glycosyltransferase [Sinosporangium album]SDI00848.1 Glycosyltransferase, catalytic subunit of cellulose synthase and poly-beta-1,6-N-acetylglucosamine synthase [Sinosporangium album]
MTGGLGHALGLTQAFALLLSVTFLLYVLTILRPYVRQRPDPAGNGDDFEWHLFIPCRDEEVVIGATLRYLRSTFPKAHLWVVDDDSEDATARIAGALADHDPFVHLVRRRRPEARVGKGSALNTAYRALDDWLGPEADRRRHIVCVLDADGRPAANMLRVCAGPRLFGDESIGAVQIAVWMINRHDRRPCADGGWWRNLIGRTLIRMQDLEFRGAISAIQLSRRKSGTVAMGDNGQLTRLSALDKIGGEGRAPWGGSLLEDFELGVHLLLAGERNEYTPDTWVEQEGLWSFRRLITQRTRWGQGTMQCAKYLPDVWRSRHFSGLGALEVLYYLSQPWLRLLGTLIYPIPLVLLCVKIVNDPADMAGWLLQGGWILFAIYAAFGVLPLLVWGPLYWWKCEPGIGFWRGLAYGFVYAVYICNFSITSWRAFFRVVRRRDGWAKTRRTSEAHTRGRPVASET